GARPHEGRDALLAGSHVVTALQSLVARELNPADCAVVTVGMFQAGSAPNVIAGNASLRGTIRAMDPAVMQRLREGVTRTVKAVAESHGARAKTILTLDAPAVVNDAGWVQRCREAAASAAGGPYAAVELPRPNMGAEDFGYYLEKVPGCYARFGARLPKGESHPAHSTRYDFDERAIAVG